jgi:hypothetical protein
MKQGKQTCKILKEIRKQIADANDIEFITSECKYKGECLGTCPKCEAEVRYLEEQLNYRRKTGKAVALLGLSAGLFTLSSAAELPATKIPDNSTHIEQTDSIIVKGVVKDHNKKLVEGAVVEDTQTHTQVLTDANGMFAIKIPQKHWLLITHPQAGNASISPAQITRKRQEVTLSNEKVFGTLRRESTFPRRNDSPLQLDCHPSKISRSSKERQCARKGYPQLHSNKTGYDKGHPNSSQPESRL